MPPLRIVSELGPDDASVLLPSTLAWLLLVANELELPMADMRDRDAFPAWLKRCIAKANPDNIDFSKCAGSEPEYYRYYIVSPLRTILECYCHPQGS